MDFEQVVRRRHMVRRFDVDRPVARAVIDELLDLARRGPSAGHSQGWHFLVLDEPAQRQSFWTATTDPDRAPDTWLEVMTAAPVLVLCWSDRQAYEQRYAEADKAERRAPGDAPDGHLEQRWPVPYWHIDTGMATLLLLLGATDRGLGACLFGVPSARVAAVRTAFDVPERFTPVGAVALGHPADKEPDAPSGSARRGRRPRREVVSYGRFGRYWPEASGD